MVQMSEIRTIISADHVQEGLTCANKKALFQQLGLLASRVLSLDSKTVVSALTEREKLGSTGFGSGVAIPHGKVEGLDKVVGLFVRLSAPIDFQSVDGLPVDLVFVLLSPPLAGAEHLKSLASVSRLLRDKQMLAKLRGASTTDAIYALLAGDEALDAA